jgi:type IV pilus assembly protein PilA
VVVARRDDQDKGFTLIELMVVVLIIAILLAIAIPTFLGAQNKAKDRSAQSSARNALTNAKTIFADNADYKLATAAALLVSEPSLTFTGDVVGAAPASSSGPKNVSVYLKDATSWYAAVLSDTGTCFYIQDSVSASGGGTSYGKDTGSDNTKCIATDSLTTGGSVTAYGPKW